MEKYELIGISGFKRSGKDAAARELSSRLGYTRVAFADALRDEVFDRYGIRLGDDDKEKPLPAYGLRTYRELLNDHSQDRRAKNPDYWVERVDAEVRKLRNLGIRVVVTDVRLPREIAWLRANGGLHVWISRPGVKSNGHVTEQDHSGVADVVIVNDASQERLGDLIACAATHKHKQGLLAA